MELTVDAKNWLKKQWSMTAVVLLCALVVCAYFVGSQTHKASAYEETQNKLHAELEQYTADRVVSASGLVSVVQESPVGWSLLAYGEQESSRFVEMQIMEESAQTVHVALIKIGSEGNMSMMYLVNQNGSVKRYGGFLKPVV